MQFEYNNTNVASFEESNKKVHIKVQYGNENRRFSVYAGSYDYSSLVQYVKRLFNFNVDSDVELKYKDDEGDMIIISSDEELKFAIELFSGSETPLRLTVDVTSKDVPSSMEISNGCGYGGQKKRFNSEGQRGFGKSRGQWKGASLNDKIEKLSSKRDELNEQLKSFGGPAPHLEAKIACIDDKVKRLIELASAPQENIPHHPHRQHRRFSSDSESREGKWGRGRGCGKWKGEHLNFKIEKLTQKRNFLSEKLKEKGSPDPCLEAKIARIDTWINKLKEFASAVPQENTHHHHNPHSTVPPCEKMGDASCESESSSEGKRRRGKGRRGCGKGRCDGKKEKWANDPICMQMWELRKEKKELKRVVNEGPESDKAATTDRIIAIMHELAQLRQKKRAEKSNK